MDIVEIAVKDLRPYEKNAKKHKFKKNKDASEKGE